MRLSVDSLVYINSAEELANGNFPDDRLIFYSSYIFIISIITTIGLVAESIIWVQMLCSVIALICIYKIAYTLSKKHDTAFIAGLLFIGWFKFQQWNLIVYTDTLLSYFIVISFYLILHYKSRYHLFFIVPVIIFTCFIRPTGILIVLATIFTYLLGVIKKAPIQYKIAIFILLTLSSFMLLNIVLKNFADSFIDSYSRAEIIYPNIPLIIEKPENLALPPSNSLPIIKILQFIFNNPTYSIKLFLLKSILFLAHIKPYYSTAHNVYIVLYIYPVYLCSLIGLFKLKGYLSYKILTTSLIILQIITIGLTSENWDGRFLLPTLPLLFILAAIGLKSLQNRFYKKNKRLSNNE